MILRHESPIAQVVVPDHRELDSGTLAGNSSSSRRFSRRIHQTASSEQKFLQRDRRVFRRHRWFLAGNWLVYYRVVDDTVYIRGLWPARIP